MNARAGRRPAGDANDADAVRRRQLLLFSVVAAVVLVAVAAWLGMGGSKTEAPEGGIDAGIVEPDAAEMVWTRRSEARLNKVENTVRQMEQEARRLRTENEGLQTRLAGQTAEALRIIDAQKAQIDELERRLQPAPPGGASGDDPWFRGQAPTQRGADARQPAVPAPSRMIETFDLDGEPQSSLSDARSGPELVAYWQTLWMVSQRRGGGARVRNKSQKASNSAVYQHSVVVSASRTQGHNLKVAG